MTTVINFNFLNFFRLKQNNISVTDDARSYDRCADAGRQNYQWQSDDAGDIVDVTPHRRALVDNNNGKGVLNIKPGGRAYLISSGIESIYNRKGKTVQCIDAKGLLVDSYV